MRKDKMCLMKGKKVMAGVLTAAMVLGGTVTAFADDYTGASGWLAEFNTEGTDIECNFEKNEVTDEMSKLEPGDSMTVSVQIKNSWSGDTDWYMENTVIQSLEDAKDSATDGGYEYVLTYNGPDGAETLYDSTTVGGEVEDDGEGLHEADGALEDYFFLDTLANGQTGTVSLKVSVDGETQGNGYQNTLAKLQMVFAVEKVNTDGGIITNNIIKTVKTGDTSKVMLYCSVALAAGLVLVIVAFKSNKNRRRERVKGE